MNLATLLREQAARQPTGAALRTREQSWTWADLDVLVDRAATALLASGDTKIAFALPNTIDFVVTLLGAFRAGILAVPINPGLTPREIDHVLSDSGARLLTSFDFRPATVDLPSVSDDQVALLLYTSGTEGVPKGAMLTHRALIANHQQLASIAPPIMSGDDVVLLALPLFHAYGLNSGLGAVLWYGACGVLEPEFDSVGTAGLIALHKVTVAIGVPPMYQAFSALPNAGSLLASLRLAVCGAAALDAEVADRFQAATGKQVHIGYGLTETAPVLTSTLASPSIKPGSIGRAIPGVSLKLVNEYGDLSEQDPGEIVVRGDNLFSGYWPDGHGGPGPDGWWPTRDVAYADADGDLFIVDRIGELILVSGFNVYPAEVEQVLTAHPDVAEAAVVGVPHPTTGQAVHAYVVSTAAADELAVHCRANLARFKCPASFEFVPELPHSATGKVRKKLLRDET